MSIRPAIVSIIFTCIAGPGFAQKPSDWKKVQQNPVEVAKKVDAGILNLKSAYGEAIFRCEYKPGTGQMTLYNRIRDRKTFRIEMAKLTDNEQDPLSTQTLYGNNGKFHFFSKEASFKSVAPGQDPTGVLTKSTPAQAWPRHFTQMIFTTLVTGKGAFTAYAKSLMDPKSGYKVEVDRRVMQSENRTFNQVRILAVRTPQAMKKFGKSTVEIIVDAVRWIPIQIRSSEVNTKGIRSNFEWTCWWKGPMRFDDKTFFVPKSAKLSLNSRTPKTSR